jgi:hypothetical protein
MNKSGRDMAVIFVRSLGGLVLSSLLCGCWAWGGSSYAKHHSVYGSVALIAHRDAFAALKKGNLTEARHALESRLRTRPYDPEVNYNLGCMDLVESDKAADRASKLALQHLGWRRVESASGKFYTADALLAHAYVVGRWGKRRDYDLYAKYLHLSNDGFRSQGGTANELEFSKRVWVLLSPP